MTLDHLNDRGLIYFLQYSYDFLSVNRARFITAPQVGGATISNSSCLEKLRTGHSVFLTKLILKKFWSKNNDFSCHVRSYNRNSYRDLATRAGFELPDA
jgi:hypothetical protein